MELKLEIGKEYSVTHKRKGFFRAVLLDMVPAPKTDREDSEFLTFEIDTSEGSGSEWVARVRGAAKTVTNIRPSLITHLQLSSRSPKLPESAEKGAEVGQEVVQEEQSFLDRVKRLFRGGGND